MGRSYRPYENAISCGDPSDALSRSTPVHLEE